MRWASKVTWMKHQWRVCCAAAWPCRWGRDGGTWEERGQGQRALPRVSTPHHPNVSLSRWRWRSEAGDVWHTHTTPHLSEPAGPPTSLSSNRLHSCLLRTAAIQHSIVQLNMLLLIFFASNKILTRNQEAKHAEGRDYTYNILYLGLH